MSGEFNNIEEFNTVCEECESEIIVKVNKTIVSKNIVFNTECPVCFAMILASDFSKTRD